LEQGLAPRLTVPATAVALELERVLMLAQVLELAQELVRQECCSSTELCTVVGHQD